MKKFIYPVALISFNFQMAYAQTSPTSNPDENECTPAMSGQQWAENASLGRDINLEPVNQKLRTLLGFLPGDPIQPTVTGEIKFKTYNKTGCCDPSDDEATTLNKYEVSGTGTIGLDTGRLPIPGLSLPAGAGGAYIGASTSFSITLAGSAQDQCGSTATDLCVTAGAGATVTLYGGLNVAGDVLDVRLSGTASLQGDLEWCKDGGLSTDGLCAEASANLTLTLLNEELWRHNFPSVTECSNR